MSTKLVHQILLDGHNLLDRERRTLPSDLAGSQHPAAHAAQPRAALQLPHVDAQHPAREVECLAQRLGPSPAGKSVKATPPRQVEKVHKLKKKISERWCFLMHQSGHAKQTSV